MIILINKNVCALESTNFVNLIVLVQTIVNQYVDNNESDEYDESDVDNMLDKLSNKNIDSKQSSLIKKLIKEGIKHSYLKDHDETDYDEIDYDKIDSKLDEIHKKKKINESSAYIYEDKLNEDKEFSLKKLMDSLKDQKTQQNIAKGGAIGVIGFDTIMYIEEKTQMSIGQSIVKLFANITPKIAAVVTNPIFIASSAVIVAATIAVITHKLKQKRMEKIIAGLQYKIDNESDSEQKEKLQNMYNNMLKTCFTKKGTPRANPKLSILPAEEKSEFKKMYNEFKWNGELKKMGKKNIDSGDWNSKSELEKFEELHKENDDSEQEKDSEGNVLKQEEITDKDGKKKKVTTHTGPRGGKFYWPDGAPKDTEHKVYISKDGKVKECMDLSDYLYDHLNKL